MVVTKWIALGAVVGTSLAATPAFARGDTVTPQSLKDATPARKPIAAKKKPAQKPIEAKPIEITDDDPKTEVKAKQDEPPPVTVELPPPPAPLPPPPPPIEPEQEPAKGQGADALANGAPPIDEAHPDAGKLVVRPYLLVSGGLKADIVKNRPGEDKENRVSTFALGRLGLRARYLDWIHAESEFMASGGVGLHGSSAYEGQAAMQVRQQMIRLGKGVWRVEVGRIIDEASVDYFSAHVAETFLQDTATRDALLFSGFNLGNGIRGTFQVIEGLRLGLTFNAGNPVSTTSSLMVGGPYPPFERFYTQPYQQVNQAANHFPDDSFHSVVVTPSVLLDTKYVDARVAVQGFNIDPNTNRSDNDDIRGYNVRGTVRSKLLDGLVIPFASAAYTRNDTLVPTDLARRARDRYQAVNLGGGVDLDLLRRFKCSHDCADGLGVSYQQVQHQIGDGLVTTLRFINVGATWWIAPNVSLGARFAWWTNEPQYLPSTGERSVIGALRFIMP